MAACERSLDVQGDCADELSEGYRRTVLDHSRRRFHRDVRRGNSGTAQTASCPGDNGGLTLSPGFCATVFADKLGHARHLAVAPNGVVYANTWSGRYYRNDTPRPGGFLIALQDTKGDGQADNIDALRPDQGGRRRGGTGIAIYKSYVYAETNDRIVRYALPPSGDRPDGNGGDGGLRPAADRRSPDASLRHRRDRAISTSIWVRRPTPARPRIACRTCPGIKPCTELETRGGTWRYDANKLDQRFSPAERFSTGLRNGEGFAFDSAGRIFATQHGRDQLSRELAEPLQAACRAPNEPAEELVQLQRGADFGWPECYYDYDQKKLVLAPEYGGDGGKTVGVCAQKQAPVAAFPAHWAPNDMLIYEGSAVPVRLSRTARSSPSTAHGTARRRRRAATMSCSSHWSTARRPAPFVVFADGFAGAHKEPGRAAHRPTGLAVGPDGALYIADDRRRPDLARHLSWRQVRAGSRPRHRRRRPRRRRRAKRVAARRHASGAGAGALPIPPGGSPDQVALGDRIFHGEAAGGTCVGCHSSDGKGSSVGSDLTSGKWLWGDGSVAGDHPDDRQRRAEGKGAFRRDAAHGGSPTFAGRCRGGGRLRLGARAPDYTVRVQTQLPDLVQVGAPHLLQRVHRPRLRLEQVHDDVAGIDQHPVGAAGALDLHALQAGLRAAFPPDAAPSR